MDILQRLAEYIATEKLFNREDHLLLAVSGGKDSMLMAELLWQLGYDISIAHCNFQLRGAESDLDQQLVVDFAAKRKIPCYHQKMETEAYAKKHGVSIQMSARALRYDWFETLRKELELDYIAIAQHQQDHIETVFVNLVRGTGLSGLKGISAKRDYIVRPLLWITIEEITNAVQLLQVPYRDDQSNFSTKYIRNKIRLNILPQFREIRSDFDNVMLENIERFEETQSLLTRLTDQIRRSTFKENGNQIEILKEDLSDYLTDLPLLYELFKPFGFEKNVLEDLVRSQLLNIGSRFESERYQLTIDRQVLILREKNNAALAEQCMSETDKQIDIHGKTFKLTLHTVRENMLLGNAPNSAAIDQEKLIFPLRIRSWEVGDRFIPLGMNGSKKISDFFIQQKIPLTEKKHIPLLVNGNGEIIWIVGYRLDNRYKITENTKKVATFVYS
ncbi:tRNA lysidine(34) synthetase TilS [Sphingobacterium corticis]|uniref:tRNA(Ile)-lysidine synthase n=1 Tax=Sphingobacterium corticis TaxID=1812823 RepID=A0ABW5NMP1_9SPHI